MKFAIVMIQIVLFSCGQKEVSQLKLDLPARHTVGEPRDIDLPDLTPPRVSLLKKSIAYQRQYSWNIWEQLFRRIEISEERSIYTFQSWYSLDDIERLFYILFSSLNQEHRDQRTDFSPEDIILAESIHLDSLFDHTHWNDETYRAWLAQFKNEEAVIGMAGMDRVLFNRKAAIHLLLHYPRLILCQPSLPSCLPEFPFGSIILKTRWQLESKPIADFRFGQKAFEAILDGDQWASSATSDQFDTGLTRESLRGYRYHLIGIHFAVKNHPEWLWSTLFWAGDKNNPFSLDAPRALLERRMAMCSVIDFPADKQSLLGLPGALQVSYRTIKDQFGNYSWCSNPYLEHGKNNHKTNCIGCHQFAGTIASSASLASILETNVEQFRQKNLNHFPNDYSWAATFGHDSVRKRIEKIIEYFDIYK